jgi:formylmethanofuran dehydrogenase subunit E
MARYELHKCGNCNRKIASGHRVEGKDAPVCNACYKKLGHKSWLDNVIKVHTT